MDEQKFISIYRAADNAARYALRKTTAHFATTKQDFDNYPMVEAFYHMKNIPDDEFITRTVAFNQLNSYKTIVNAENRNHDYTKFAVDKAECNIVINQNIEKGMLLAGNTGDNLPDSTAILNKELELLETENTVSVLCTCSYYIAKYNPAFLK